MGRSFSEDLKWRIVYLYQDRYSKRRISELLYMSYSGICKTLRNFRRWNCVDIPPLEVLPRCSKTGTWRSSLDFSIKLNIYSITESEETVEERVDWFLDELVVEMEAIAGKRVSIPTLNTVAGALWILWKKGIRLHEPFLVDMDTYMW